MAERKRQAQRTESHLRPDSWLVSAGRERRAGQPLNVPPTLASNFVLGGSRAYSRDDGTPTWKALEDVVGGLEGGYAVAFASGMAAIAAVFDQLPVGSAVALSDDCYQGVVGLAEAGRVKGRWRVERIAGDDTRAWIRACDYADLVWLESPSNPLLVVADVEAICAAPRKPGGLLAVDNTFATPLNQRPLALGADFSIQSATKCIGGHSDLLAGVVTAADERRCAALQENRVLAGATPGALEAYLAVRGARTMALRLERAQQTAMRLATRLESHPQVELVRYPGLPSHPTHKVARRQLKGFGTMISFDVRGEAEIADAVCTHLSLVEHATSLGAVESSIERRAAVPGQEHLPASLLRLSVGIEDADDLWADLDQALQRASGDRSLSASRSDSGVLPVHSTNGLNHLALPVRDPERSARFYSGLFNMEITFSSPEVAFVKTVGAKTVGARDMIAFNRSDAQIVSSRDTLHFGFMVEPERFDEAVRSIEAAGVKKISEPSRREIGRYIFIEDPDGYVVEIFECLVAPFA